jgi:magnesium-transporting ATPase (P-type)
MANNFSGVREELKSMISEAVNGDCTREDMEKYFKSSDEILKKLNSNAEKGLSGEDYGERDREFNKNKDKNTNSFSSLPIIFSYIKQSFLLLTFLSASLYQEHIENGFNFSGMADEFLILAISLSFSIYYIFTDIKKKEEQEMDNTDFLSAVVLNNGKKSRKLASDIRVGDIVLLETGDTVPCDGILLKATGFAVNEAEMTGEPDLASKIDYDSFMKLSIASSPVVIETSFVKSGSGLMIACAVGEHSMYGQIKDKVIKKEKTVDEDKLPELNRDALRLSKKLRLVFNSLTYITLITSIGNHVLTQYSTNPDYNLAFSITLNNFVRFLGIFLMMRMISGISDYSSPIIINLSMTMRRMMMEGLMARSPNCVSKLGEITMALIDKTDVLVSNRFAVTRFVLGKIEEVDYDADVFEPEGLFPTGKSKDMVLDSMIFTLINVQPSPSDAAFGEFVEKCGVSPQKKLLARKQDIVQVFGFTSKRKMLSVILKNCDDTKHDNGLRLYSKGASEPLLAKCSHFLDEEGKRVELDANSREKIENYIVELGLEGQRTVAFAYKDLETGEGGEKHDEDADKVKLVENSGLTLACIVGTEFPILPGTTRAIQTLKDHGVKVKLVTGDNRITAIRAAKESRITEEDEPKAFEGVHLSTITEEELSETLEQTDIFPRCAPQSIQTLVQGYQKLGEKVLLIANGTNCAPAMKQADVAICGGQIATEIAKQASDIISMGDILGGCVRALTNGKDFIHSSRKGINVSAILSMSLLLITIYGSVILDEALLGFSQIYIFTLAVSLVIPVILAGSSYSTRSDGNISTLSKKPCFIRTVIFGTVTAVTVIAACVSINHVQAHCLFILMMISFMLFGLKTLKSDNIVAQMAKKKGMVLLIFTVIYFTFVKIAANMTQNEWYTTFGVAGGFLAVGGVLI